jgi:hypothetical protein
MKCRFFVAAFGLVLATAVAASAAPLVTGGLVFYYSFDDITTGDDVIVNDGSGNGMDGKVVTAASAGQTSSITFVPGVYGNAASFNVSAPDDAANDDYATIEIVNCWDTAGEPDPLGPDGDPADGAYSYAFQNDGDEPNPADIPTNAMTLALWVNTDSKSVGHSSQATFCASAYDPDHGKSDGLGNARAAWPYHLEVRNNDYRYTIRYDGGVGGTMQTIVSENVPNPTFGEWSHIAWVYNSSPAKWSFYLNGDEVATGVPAAAQPIDDNWDNGALLGLNPDIARQFTGEMDEVYMFKRALSASEIAILAEFPGLQGDLNGDGWVNSGDLDLVRANWGTNNAAGDANGDGVVNSSDLDIIRANWGAHMAAAAVIPEPTTVVLLGAMGLLACLIRRK